MSYRRAERLRNFFIHVFLSLLALTFALPFIVVVSGSLSSEKGVIEQGYMPYPVDFSLAAYEYILKVPQQILTSYRVTIIVTAVGTGVGLLLAAMLAYALARRTFRLRNLLSFGVFFTILFNGGTVPYYILVTQYLKLRNTLWALIIPPLIVPWYVLILRTYFSGLPEGLLDAAKIDGAGEWRIFFQIAVPLSKPALATIGLFYVMMYWNNWTNALLFIDKAALTPLQYLLQQMLMKLNFLTQHAQEMPGIDLPPVPLATIRMAMAVVAAGPVILAFLFLQKYFVRGLTIGAFKGGGE